MAEKVLQFLFEEDQEKEAWWIATFDELKDILPENLKTVPSKDVVDKLRFIITKATEK